MGQLVKEPILKLEDIEAAVTFINDQVQSAQKSFLEIGKYILDHFFGGSIDRAISTDPNKNVSYTQLADHPKLQIDPSTLSRCVALHIQQAQMIQASKSAKRLLEMASPTHQRILLPVKQPERKVELLGQAVKKGLSTREFRGLVDAEKQNIPSKRGRKPRSQFQKSWQKALRVVAEQQNEFEQHREAFLSEHSVVPDETKNEWLNEIETVLQYFQSLREVVTNLPNNETTENIDDDYGFSTSEEETKVEEPSSVG